MIIYCSQKEMLHKNETFMSNRLKMTTTPIVLRQEVSKHPKQVFTLAYKLLRQLSSDLSKIFFGFNIIKKKSSDVYILKNF